MKELTKATGSSAEEACIKSIESSMPRISAYKSLGGRRLALALSLLLVLV